MWELYTGGHAYKGVPRALLPHEIARRGLRPSFPADAPFAYRFLACRCMETDPVSPERDNQKERGGTAGRPDDRAAVSPAGRRSTRPASHTQPRWTVLRVCPPPRRTQLIRPTFEQALGDLEMMVAKLRRDNVAEAG